MHVLLFNLEDFAFYKTTVIAKCSDTHRHTVKNWISKLSTYQENKSKFGSCPGNNGWVKDFFSQDLHLVHLLRRLSKHRFQC